MNANSIRGVIFDLDGTLIDSFQAIYLSFRHAYEKMGLRPPLSFEEVREVVGQGLGVTFRQLVGEARTPEALAYFREHYQQVYRENTFFLQGAREVLEGLHQNGIPMAVATNKLGRFSREIFGHFGMTHVFAAILGDGDVPHPKPHPGMLDLALEKMSLSRDHVVMVGDSLIDIEAARNANMRVYGVATGVLTREELQQAGPTAVMGSLEELLEFVLPKQPQSA